MWLMPLVTRVARPMARGRQRRMCLSRALSAMVDLDEQVVEVDALVLLTLRVRDGAVEQLDHREAPPPSA